MRWHPVTAYRLVCEGIPIPGAGHGGHPGRWVRARWPGTGRDPVRGAGADKGGLTVSVVLRARADSIMDCPGDALLPYGGATCQRGTALEWKPATDGEVGTT